MDESTNKHTLGSGQIWIGICRTNLSQRSVGINPSRVQVIQCVSIQLGREIQCATDRGEHFQFSTLERERKLKTAYLLDCN